jgi:energy-coupling factor transporter ATP-binding protein EcfA2
VAKLVCCVFALFIVVAVTTPVWSQTVQSDQAEQVRAEIRGYADRHAQAKASLQTQLVVDLYRGNSAGLTPTDIARIYEEEYTAAQKRSGFEPAEWLASLLGIAGWGAAVLIGAVALFKEPLKKAAQAVGKFAISKLIVHLSGLRLARFVALGHYRKALFGRYELHQIPFRRNRPIPMRELFIPLRLSSGETAQTDIYAELSETQHLVVVGRPGSGKSMLLRQLLYTFSSQGRLPGVPREPVPVMIELHRLSDPNLSVRTCISDEFKRNHFDNPNRFITHQLKNGGLLLLFDGLDEVKASERARVIQAMRDFLDENNRPAFILTCRTAVYRNEFDDLAERSLLVDDFSDRQIRLFLNAWAPDMPVDKAPEHLMETLHDAPRIMALARNPLLLTMIAYLYTDTPATLPHSRAAFYQRATELLLNEWQEKRNEFDARDKRLALQHLAMYCQDNAQRGDADRRLVSYETTLHEFGKVLERLQVPPGTGPQALLDEIVERSGLLVPVDGGTQYQFAHLTLQEYFAAAELIGDPDKLISRSRTDISAWREVLKLWCGMAVDCTQLVMAIEATDPIAAFECLADARKIDAAHADALVGRFEEMLGYSDDDLAVEAAFGAVAAEPGARGLEVLAFLESALSGADPKRRPAAARAFAQTNLPRAADALARRFAESSDAPASLVRLGDVAVPALGRLAYVGELGAIDCLGEIGTASAVDRLVNLLSAAIRPAVSYRAAWVLGVLLRPTSAAGADIINTEAQDLLAGTQLPPPSEFGPLIDWVATPLEKAYQSRTLSIILARIAYVLSTGPVEAAPSPLPVADMRVVVPQLILNSPQLVTRLEVLLSRRSEADVERQSRFVASLEASIESESMGAVRSSTAEEPKFRIQGLGGATRRLLEVPLEYEVSRVARELDGFHVELRDQARNHFNRTLETFLGTNERFNLAITAAGSYRATEMLVSLFEFFIPTRDDWSSLSRSHNDRPNRWIVLLSVGYFGALSLTAVAAGLLNSGITLFPPGAVHYSLVICCLLVVAVLGFWAYIVQGDLTRYSREFRWWLGPICLVTFLWESRRRLRSVSAKEVPLLAAVIVSHLGWLPALVYIAWFSWPAINVMVFAVFLLPILFYWRFGRRHFAPARRTLPSWWNSELLTGAESEPFAAV